MTKQFFCHYTGKDGFTPRRRLQQLTFFDHVPSIGNSTSSPTPLWVEVFHRCYDGHKHDVYVVHAQLSENVAVYVEHLESSHTCQLLNDLADGKVNNKMLCRAIADMRTSLLELTDYTTYLLSHPDRITPPILAAYKEARPEEYQKLQSLYMY